MLFAKKTKVAVILYGIFVIIFYAYLLFFLFFAPGAPVVEMIGEAIFPYEVRYTGFVLISFLASLVITTITTFHLGIYLMKRETRENKWKGRFLVMGMAIITVSVFIDMAVADIIFIIVIVRILGIIAMLFIYFGFILPNWMRRALSLELKQT